MLGDGLVISRAGALDGSNLFFQVGLETVQFAQLFVERFNGAGQLGLLGLDGLHALVVVRLELVEFGAERFGNLFYILDICGHGSLLQVVHQGFQVIQGVTFRIALVDGAVALGHEGLGLGDRKPNLSKGSLHFAGRRDFAPLQQ